jgi:hypothetical protein
MVLSLMQNFERSNKCLGGAQLDAPKGRTYDGDSNQKALIPVTITNDEW